MKKEFTQPPKKMEHCITAVPSHFKINILVWEVFPVKNWLRLPIWRRKSFCVRMSSHWTALRKTVPSLLPNGCAC